MTKEELAKEYVNKLYAEKVSKEDYDKGGRILYRSEDISDAFLDGLNAGRPKWRNVFTKGEPYAHEYWDIPQDNLPNENFYFVKLKNGFVKICELKYDIFGKGKCFYDLKGGKQSNVAFWLEYPTEA